MERTDRREPIWWAAARQYDYSSESENLSIPAGFLGVVATLAG